MSWQDIQHHYIEYDECPHGAPGGCSECEAERLRRFAAIDEEEIGELQQLLVDLYRVVVAHGLVHVQAHSYLALHGLLQETTP